MDHELLRCLKEKGYSDFECKQVVYGESIKEVRASEFWEWVCRVRTKAGCVLHLQVWMGLG